MNTANMKYRFAILKNELPESHIRWQTSCQKANVVYDIIDLMVHDWYEKCLNKEYDCYLLKPPGEIQRFKDMYNERVYILSEVLGKFVYPSYNEIFIHENKKLLAYYLKANGIPHPETNVFYRLEEAMAFAENTKYPIVAKTSIGASGTGVTIVKESNSLKKYIRQAFGKGIKRRFGPNRNTGNIRSWTSKACANPSWALKKIKKYFDLYTDAQKGFVIFQEYIPHDYEWRIVKIGDSFFGHKKIKKGDKASGTKGIEYVRPPEALLNFSRDLCLVHHFNSMAIDLFEHPNKGYVVNELQTIFGHVQDHILEVDGKPGRYLFKSGYWIFEAGNFNTNESYDLRLQYALELFGNKKN